VENETEEMRRDFIPFGSGSRQCIARNLATVELFAATAEIVRSGVLEGSRPADEKLANGNQRIPILEWFNSKVVGGHVDLRWN
jgi:cytochrome P450